MDSDNQSADQRAYPEKITAAQLAATRLIQSRTFVPCDHGAASLGGERWTKNLADPLCEIVSVSLYMCAPIPSPSNSLLLWTCYHLSIDRQGKTFPAPRLWRSFALLGTTGLSRVLASYSSGFLPVRFWRRSAAKRTFPSAATIGSFRIRPGQVT